MDASNLFSLCTFRKWDARASRLIKAGQCGEMGTGRVCFASEPLRSAQRVNVKSKCEFMRRDVHADTMA